MISYTEGVFFKKYWEWFATPHEVPDVAIANFFAYERVDVPGFSCKPGLTSSIDLHKSIEEIWEGARKKFIREQIERGRRRGVTVEKSENFAAFDAMYGRFAKRSNFDRISNAALRHGTLFLAYFEGRPVAGGVYIGDGISMRALALASHRFEGDGRMRDIIGAANRMVIWEAIVWAKENGYALFDLGGIAPDSPNKHWASVAAFKESFGGERRAAYYYHKVYSPLLKRWMRLRRLFR